GRLDHPGPRSAECGVRTAEPQRLTGATDLHGPGRAAARGRPRCNNVLRYSIPAPRPGFGDRPAFAIDRSGREAVEPQRLAYDLRDHHASHRAAETFVQSEAEGELIAETAGRVEIVRMRHG